MKRKATILLLDDDPFQIRLLTRQLQNLGYERVVSFISASEALAALKDPGKIIDMMFLDLKMPDMDGVEVLRQLSGMHYDGALVLLSGADKQVVEVSSRLARAHQLNLLGALSKPCVNAELQAIFEHWGRTVLADNPSDRKTYRHDEIRHGIEQGEFVNFYQPKVKLLDGTFTGVETLVRWDHPSDGLVYPDQFIPEAEEHGLIHNLTRNVLAEALSQLGRWREAGLKCGVAVNVSMLDLTDLVFPEYILGELRRTGVVAEDLTLEVTESRVIKGVRAAMEIMLRLRLKGVGLSIDDFGTGHSSLSQLRDLPFSEIKLDRGFVDSVHRNPTLSAIVEASGDMARHLNMNVVAEGVESLADWNWLRARGYDLAQGYLIAKPMPGEELAGWLSAWRSRKQELLEGYLDQALR